MPARFDRAMLLFRQSRYDLAERELRSALADDPNDPLGHAFLALCLVERDDHTEATREAFEAIRLEPDLDLAHFAMGVAMLRRNRLDDADRAVEEAIRLDPTDPDYYSLQASIRMHRRRWADALASAEKGLAFDAEHVGCNNVRAQALVQLGRRDEAGATIASALRRDPEDAASHANLGWTLLHQGQPRKAMEHFREALRIEPTMEWARMGIVEAMKARNPIYRMMLAFFLWNSRLSQHAQFGLLIGLVLAQMFLGNLSRGGGQVGTVAGIALGLLIAFVVMTWISVPLFNLLLRVSRFGRLALSPEQITGSNWLLAYIASGLACLAVGLLKDDGRAVEAAINFGFLLLPVGGIYLTPRGWPRDAMKAIALALTVMGPGLLAVLMFAPPGSPAYLKADRLHDNFISAVVLSTWLGVFIARANVRR
jgi:tetratricopeptide (TPR) repeat protein